MEARFRRVIPAVAALAVLACGCTRVVDDASPAVSVEVAETTAASAEFFDIGGRLLYLMCWGEPVAGEPTMLLVAGLGAHTTTWDPFATDFADDGHHLCAYDRQGVGASDSPRDASRTTRDQVADLMALLEAAEMSGPFVVVGHSLGSLPAVAFVAHAPERVAGVVLLDPWSPRVTSVQRALLPPEQPTDSPALSEERWVVNEWPFDPAQNSEHLLIDACDAEVAALMDEAGPLFGDLPVVVVLAPLGQDPPGLPDSYVAAATAAIIAGRQEFADESTKGVIVQLEDSGHSIHWDHPRVVMDAILDVMSR